MPKRPLVTCLLTILVVVSLSACSYVNQTDLVRRDKAETERRVRRAIAVGAPIEGAERVLTQNAYHCAPLPPLQAAPPYYDGTPPGVREYGCVAHLAGLASRREYSVYLEARSGVVRKVDFVAEEFGGGLGMVD
jgi:hypothetical protein